MRTEPGRRVPIIPQGWTHSTFLVRKDQTGFDHDSAMARKKFDSDSAATWP